MSNLASGREAGVAAAARVPVMEPDYVPLRSVGRCLLLASGSALTQAIGTLRNRLDLIACTTERDEAALRAAASGIPVAIADVAGGRGFLGAFEVSLSSVDWIGPSPAKGLVHHGPIAVDLVLDLSQRASLFHGCYERDGYIRANPHNAAEMAAALELAGSLVGEFEKPRYASFDAGLCAHARNGTIGCRKCLDACPTGAIAPEGDVVAIDAGVCEGCGLCSAVCPTGAMTYTLPRPADLLTQARALIKGYVEAGGKQPMLLVNEAAHGASLLAILDETEKAIAGTLLPLAVNSALAVGHDLLLGLLLAGACRVVLLVPPRHRISLSDHAPQALLATHILDAMGLGKRVIVLAEDDPDVIGAALKALATIEPVAPIQFGTTGSRREVARVMLSGLAATAPLKVEPMSLPAGAPYGRVALDKDRCTLCLACASVCPTGALRDNAESPALRFTEAACVQCGLCVATCPERALSLEPRLSLGGEAATPCVLKAEEPSCCIACGRAFGSPSSIARVKRRLADHALYQDPARLKLIEMCDACRAVRAVELARDPLVGRARPPPVTSEDYIVPANAQPTTKTEA